MGCSSSDDGPAGPTLDTTAPAVPSGVTATAILGGAVSIRVSWNANETDADLAGYCIYRSRQADGSYLPVEEGMLVPTNAWTDTRVQAGGTYYYRVSARDASANESSLSSAVGLQISVSDGDGPPRVSD
jgi:fibronectin type 3 domain-containing protein